MGSFDVLDTLDRNFSMSSIRQSDMMMNRYRNGSGLYDTEELVPQARTFSRGYGSGGGSWRNKTYYDERDFQAMKEEQQRAMGLMGPPAGLQYGVASKKRGGQGILPNPGYDEDIQEIPAPRQPIQSLGSVGRLQDRYSLSAPHNPSSRSRSLHQLEEEMKALDRNIEQRRQNQKLLERQIKELERPSYTSMSSFPGRGYGYPTGSLLPTAPTRADMSPYPVQRQKRNVSVSPPPILKSHQKHQRSKQSDYFKKFQPPAPEVVSYHEKKQLIVDRPVNQRQSGTIALPPPLVHHESERPSVTVSPPPLLTYRQNVNKKAGRTLAGDRQNDRPSVAVSPPPVLAHMTSSTTRPFASQTQVARQGGPVVHREPIQDLYVDEQEPEPDFIEYETPEDIAMEYGATSGSFSAASLNNMGSMGMGSVRSSSMGMGSMPSMGRRQDLMAGDMHERYREEYLWAMSRAQPTIEGLPPPPLPGQHLQPQPKLPLQARLGAKTASGGSGVPSLGVTAAPSGLPASARLGVPAKAASATSRLGTNPALGATTAVGGVATDENPSVFQRVGFVGRLGAVANGDAKSRLDMTQVSRKRVADRLGATNGVAGNETREPKKKSKVVLEEGQYYCQSCRFIYIKGAYPSEKDNAVFNTKFDLLYHYKEKYGIEEEITCDFTGMKFPSLAKYQQHMLKGSKSHTPFCRRHLLCVNYNGLGDENSCSLMFSNKINLLNHLRKKHGVNLGPDELIEFEVDIGKEIPA